MWWIIVGDLDRNGLEIYSCTTITCGGYSINWERGRFWEFGSMGLNGYED